MYLTVKFQKFAANNTVYHVVYFEQNGEDIHTFKPNADLVFVPDPEIGKVSWIPFPLFIYCPVRIVSTLSENSTQWKNIIWNSWFIIIGVSWVVNWFLFLELNLYPWFTEL